jgi:hypothetical protein
MITQQLQQSQRIYIHKPAQLLYTGMLDPVITIPTRLNHLFLLWAYEKSCCRKYLLKGCRH